MKHSLYSKHEGRDTGRHRCAQSQQRESWQDEGRLHTDYQNMFSWYFITLSRQYIYFPIWSPCLNKNASCFPRLATISDRLDREQGASSDTVSKRLARLEEQVVTRVCCISCDVHCSREAWCWNDMTHFLAHVCLFDIYFLTISSHYRCFTLACFTSSGRPVSQIPAVDYGQSKISGICTKRSTITELVANLLTYFIVNFVNIVSPSQFCCSLQHWQQQTSSLTGMSVLRRGMTGSTWTPGSFSTPAAKSNASLCRTRKCHGRYFVCLFNMASPSTSHIKTKMICVYPNLISCPPFSGQLQLIHANLLHLWRQRWPRGWVRFQI